MLRYINILRVLKGRHMKIYKLVTMSLLALITACSVIQSTDSGNQVEKKPDAKLRLNDIWALEKIQGKSISLVDGMQRPQLEIHLRDMKVIGNDGCNHFSGAITSLDDSEIIFGPMMGSRMFCQGMDMSNKFNSHINNVQSYLIKDLTLYFFDELGNELLSFRKID